MDRNALNFARGGVVLAVLFALVAILFFGRAIERGGEAWIMAVAHSVFALSWLAIAAWNFRKAKRGSRSS